MVASFHRSTGLSVTWSDPLWVTGRTVGVSISKQVARWSHTIAADGGYKSASFEIATTQFDVETWLENGLGRHIELHSPEGVKIGEYFVNQVSVRIGGLTISRGPLMQVANRVMVAYTPVLSVCEDPWPTGEETITTLAEDADSQAKYGILETMVSGGTLVDDTTSSIDETGVSCITGTLENEAEQMRDTYLMEYKNPETTQELSVGEGSTPSVTCECLGYEAFFDKYVYTEELTGTQTLTEKLTAVVEYDPNSLFGKTEDEIETVGFLVLKQEITNRTARAIINELVNIGNSTYGRTTFGIYNNRHTVFASVPTSVEYYYRVGVPSPQVEDMAGNPIRPWDVLPARWLFVPDLMIGLRASATTLRLDPRCMLVESVTYTSPFGLSLSGGKVSKFSQLLAQRGLGI